MPPPVPTYELYGEVGNQRPDFWLHCETIAARSSTYRWEIGLHRHASFQQILYIREGAGDLCLTTETLPLAPPCIVAIPSGVSHGFRFSRDIDGLVITVLAERLRLMSRRAATGRLDWLTSPQVMTLNVDEDRDYLDNTLNRLFQEFQSHRADGSALIEAYLNLILVSLSRQMDRQRKRLPADGKHARVDLLKDLIARHFQQHISASAYAEMLHLSPTHLNRLVRESTGMTVHDLIMARVLDEARRALVFTPASIQSIAEQVGFSDAAYFARCFRERTGRTPRQYRQEEQQKLLEATPAGEAELTP